MIATYFRVDNTLLTTLKSLSDHERVEYINQRIQDEQLVQLDLGKLWDVLHVALTEQSATTPIPDHPISEAVVGIETFSDDPDAAFISYIEWAMVAEISEALHQVNFAKRLAKLELKTLRQLEVFPKGIWQDKKPQLDKALQVCFEELKAFYEDALDTGSNVVVAIF